MRSMRMMGFVLLAGLLVFSCFGDATFPGGEVTELAGLKIDESRMTSEIRGDRLDLSLVLERTEQRSFVGVIKVELEDLSGETLDSAEVPFVLDRGEKTFGFGLGGLPADAGLEDLANYLVTYRAEWERYALFGARSVFTTVEKLEAQVLAPSRLYEGEGTFLRVLARDPSSGEARPGIPVSVELDMNESTTALGQGVTDIHGTAEVYIEVPEGMLGQGTIRISIAPDDGNQEIVDGSVEILREEKILLTTDKPIYQPGQTIHMRLLALRRPALNAVGGEDVLFEVRDGKGNKVFKQRGQTNEFGIAAADFRLATEVNMGPFELMAQVGTTQSYKTVEIKRYALPKFSVSFRPDRGYYLPGERVTGQVEARYFFGQPVAGGSVRVKVLTFDVGLVEIGEVVGVLNGEGLFGFHFDLPTAFAGIDLLAGDAYLQFDVEVVDLAEHTETVSAVSTVAASPLKVSLIPESGDLVPGVTNRIHVVTADPTGLPVPAQLTVTADGLPAASVSTDARGLGVVALVPVSESLTLHVAAADALGNQVEKDFSFQAGVSGSSLLLRVDRRLYQTGDTARLTIWAHDARDRIYLDVIKGNQTLLTHSLDLTDGQAVFELDLTPDMEGNVQFDAYYLTQRSQIVRDTQLVLVQGARDLEIRVTLDEESYLPAEIARVTFEVTDLAGAGVAAAIGLAIVDEAVFALTEFRPGLAEVFFEIEQDIMKPRYQIVSSSALYDYLDSDRDSEEREAAAAVVFAAAQGFAGYGIEKNTYVEASKRVAQVVRERVNADAEEIVAGMQALAEQGLITEENFASWLDRRQGSWFDPFGQPYRLEVLGQYEWDYTLVFHSAGPDELVGSADDVASDGYYAWWIFYGRGYGEGWFEDDLANGADPGAGPPHDQGGGEPDKDGESGSEDNGPPRVRSWFPETLYVNPAVITDGAGRATLEIPLADSITTWRMTSLANSVDGQIGSRSDGILVFQDFFIDVDFPATLTRGDQVSVPVAVYNYLDQPQSIRLEIADEAWFILQDSSTKTIDLEAGGVGVVYFTVVVDQVGWHGLTVHGYGSVESDAVRRTVQIVPDGKEFREGRSDRLTGRVDKTVHIPEQAIDGASRIFVKVYPGLMSQAVEGLDSLLRIPSGCFEQTTTTAWPNIMVLNYMQAAGQLTPEIELKARDYVNQSYQRILTFECPSGGFNWWVGDDPGNAILSAMSLMMFSDAREAVDLDFEVAGRTVTYVLSQQRADGSWSGESHLHAGNGVYGETGLRASAFCAWGLGMWGHTGSELALAAAYLRSAMGDTDDLYSLALVANALAWVDPHDPALAQLVTRIQDARIVDENGLVHWETLTGTASGAQGNNGHVEATALVAQALMKTGMYPELVEGAIGWLIQQKDTFGTWYSTQPTVQSLRAMVMSMDFAASQDVNGTVHVDINGAADACTFIIDPDNSDVTRICELDAWTVEGDNAVSVSLDGEGSFLYQVVGVHYLPWDMVSDSPDGPLSIEVGYDRTNLSVDDTVEVTVTVAYNVPGERVAMVMVDLGIPPGFDPLTEDLTVLVQDVPNITRYEIRGRQLSIYIDELAHGAPLTFSYRMRARFPIHGSAPESTVWAYYNPEMRATSKPVMFEVVR